MTSAASGNNMCNLTSFSLCCQSIGEFQPFSAQRAYPAALLFAQHDPIYPRALLSRGSVTEMVERCDDVIANAITQPDS